LKVIRPRDLSPDFREELVRYLCEQWTRAEEGRRNQVEGDYERWNKNYAAVPRELQRSLPWPGASNIVVPLIRMHLDTMVARTLGVTFATQPLAKICGYPQELADDCESYLNYKARCQWGIYEVASEMLFSGLKNGLAPVKIPWIDQKTIDIMPGDGPEDFRSTEVDLYVGPRPEVIPFEDYYVYPVTATRQHHIQIRFQRLRFTDEQVKEMCDAGKWLRSFEGDGDTPGLKTYLKKPDDVKRASEQSVAGVEDQYLYELQPVECSFRYKLPDGQYYDLLAILLPEARDILDLYFNPFPLNMPMFMDYIPFKREGLYWGESLCQILEGLQEEASSIHNDRRNNSWLANSPVFKKKSGSLIPNPSTSWYPGKVFTVDEMDDFEMMNVGQMLNPMIDQEMQVYQIAQLVMGHDATAMGSAQGSMGKGGVYNTGGTMALLAETNDRQSKSIRDYREALGGILKTSFILQGQFQPDDPAIAYFPADKQARIKQALEYAFSNPQKTHLAQFEISTSTAAANKEIERQSLMQMAGVINNYNQAIQPLVMGLLSPNGQNPALQFMTMQVLKSMDYMAKRLLRAWDEIDPEGALPNVDAILQKAGKGQQQPSGPQPVQPGGNAPNGPPLSRPDLENISAMAGRGAQAMGGATAA
jgi:hypothetical protein